MNSNAQNHHGRQKTPPARPHDPAWRRAFERLDEALEKNTADDLEDERIRLLRLAVFGSAPD